MSPAGTILIVLVRGSWTASVRVDEENCLTHAAELMSVAARGVAVYVHDDDDDNFEWRGVVSGRRCPWLLEYKASRLRRLYERLETLLPR